ncbi:hypothetical protein JTB14_021230 [Gonioctena quinquepunctata]|nr:hypothetical protein JTB14_021230 [Gonioctena quinquepunctata]
MRSDWKSAWLVRGDPKTCYHRKKKRGLSAEGRSETYARSGSQNRALGDSRDDLVWISMTGSNSYYENRSKINVAIHLNSWPVILKCSSLPFLRYSQIPPMSRSYEGRCLI